jgi:N-acetyltransferase
VALVPLAVEHVDGLASAGAEDRTTYEWTWVPDGTADAAAYVDLALRQRVAGRRIPFAVLDPAGRVVGSTSYFPEYHAWDVQTGRPDVVEIGATWYAASVQRTALNTEAKLLLLTHAFEHWQVARVCLKTDALNRRSRDAIERVGARFEGVLRHHMPAYGRAGLRDSAYYSILPDEWPEVRRQLEARPGHHS